MPEPRPDLMWLLDESDRTKDNLRMLEAVERAEPAELDRALDPLSATAALGAPNAVHLYAIGLAMAGRLDEALDAFGAAIEGRPDRVEFRMNLAAAYARADDVERALDTLDDAIAATDSGQIRLSGAGSERIRASVRHRRDELAEWRDRDLRRAQVRAAGLRERVESGEATVDDRLDLADQLLALHRDLGAVEALTEAEMHLESVRRAQPGNLKALELLAQVERRR